MSCTQNNFFYDFELGIPVIIEENDPICGQFSGAAGNFYFSPKYVFTGTNSNCETFDVNEISGLQKNVDYIECKYIDWSSNENKSIFLNLSKSGEIFAVYNDYDKKSGVVIFKSNHSEYGVPKNGFFYGVKFCFQNDDEVLLEGGYNSDFNEVSTLEEAVKKFGYENLDYFSKTSWNSLCSGAKRK